MSAKQEQTLLIALNARGGKLPDTYLDALGVCHQAHALTLNSTGDVGGAQVARIGEVGNSPSLASGSATAAVGSCQGRWGQESGGPRGQGEGGATLRRLESGAPLGPLAPRKGDGGVPWPFGARERGRNPTCNPSNFLKEKNMQPFKF